MLKKILTILLATMLLVSATGCTKTPKLTKITSEEFQKVMLQWFKEDITEDFLSYHFGVNDPSTYDLEKPEVTWGHVEDDEEDHTLEDRIALLASWDTSNLTDDELITYKSLVSYYDLLKRDSEIETNYTFLFTPNSGINNNLITNMTEFEIREEQDAIDLIWLAYDAARYIDECIAYTKDQFDHDILQSDDVIYKIIEQCQRFISKVENNEIIYTVGLKLDRCGYEKNDEYKAQLADAVINWIIPAYQRVIDMYQEIYYSDKQAKTLSQYGDEGKKTYEILFQYKSSSSISVDEYKGLLRSAVSAEYKKMMTIANASYSDYTQYAYGRYSYNVTDAYDTFLKIKEKMSRDFPEYPEVDYTISYLDPTVTSDSIAAYYLIAPVDNYNYNIVKVNPTYAENNPVGIVPTLAHEGYPGHLYQHTYYTANHPNNEVRYNLNFMGYTEGWAMYVETVANGYFGLSKNLVALINADNALGYYLEAYIDILINYNGYGVSDVAKVLADLGFNENAAYDIYTTLVGDPCILTPYAVGLYNFAQLQKSTSKALGDKYSSVEFHKVILDAGATSFDILKEVVDQYVANKQK